MSYNMQLNNNFNRQMILQQLMQGLQAQQGGGYNAGFQDGVQAGQMQVLQQLGLLQPGQMQQYQHCMGHQSQQMLDRCCPGAIFQPEIGLSGAPAGKGLQKDPAGWPQGSVRTAGGYTVVPEGNTSWKVFGPDQKPGDKPNTHVHGDPHVDQKDGTRWDFTKNSDFVLPDGTRINCKTSSEKGYSVSTGLEITNGADRVSISGVDGRPKVSDITHDGYEWRAQHLAENPNRDTFRMGGNGAEWFLERGGENMGKITGAHMDSKTGAYVQHTDGQNYHIDPNLRPPFGSVAWGHQLRGEALDRISQMGLPPEYANAFGQAFHAEHSTSQLQQSQEQLSNYMGPWGALRMMFEGPQGAFDAVNNMSDALNSLNSLNQDMLLQRQSHMYL